MFDASHVEQLFSSTSKTLQRSTLVLSERCISCRSSIMNEKRNSIKDKMLNVITSSTVKAPFVSAVGNTSLKHLITSLHRLASFSDYVNTCNDLSTFIEHKLSVQVTEKSNTGDIKSSNSNNNENEEKQRTNNINVFLLFKSITNALCTATLGECNTNKFNDDDSKETNDKDYCYNDSKIQQWSELWYSEEKEMSMETSSHNSNNNNIRKYTHNDVNANKVSSPLSSSSLRRTNKISHNINSQLNTLSNTSPWDATQRQGECNGASLTRLLCVNAFIVNAWYLLPNVLERITKCYKQIIHNAELEDNTENVELQNEWTIQEQNYYHKEMDSNLSLCLSQLSQLLPRLELFKVLHSLLELLHSENILTLMLFPAIPAYALEHNMSTLNSQYILGPLEDVAHSLYGDYLQSEKNFEHHCYDVLCMLTFYINAFVLIHLMKEEKYQEIETRMVQQLRHVHEILLFALESTFHASNARPEMSRALYTHLVKPYHNVVCKVILNKTLPPHLSQNINSIYMTAEYRLLLIVESVAIAEKHMSSGQRSLSLQQQRYAHLLTSSDGKMTINLLTTIAEDKNLLCEETSLRSPNGHRVYKIHEMEFAEDIKHATINDGQHQYNAPKTGNVSLYVYVDHGVIYYKRSNKLRQSFTPATSVDELFSCF